mgnify:CR=1 FL=1
MSIWTEVIGGHSQSGKSVDSTVSVLRELAIYCGILG